MHGQGNLICDNGDIFIGKFYTENRKVGKLTYKDTGDKYIGHFENN